MSRSGASRPIDVAVVLLAAALPVAVLATVRALPAADLGAAGLGWLPTALAWTLAATASGLALATLVAGLRGGSLAALLTATGAAALAGGALALGLGAGNGMVGALPFIAAALLAAGLAELGERTLATRRARIGAAGAGLLGAEAVVIAGAVLGSVIDAWQAPLLGGTVLAGALAILVMSDRWSAAAAAGLAIGAGGLLLDRGAGLEGVLGLLSLVGATLAGLGAARRRTPSGTVVENGIELPSLAHHLDDAVLAFDGGLTLRDWNAPASALLGLDVHVRGSRLEDLLGVPMGDLPSLEGPTLATTAVGGLVVRLYRSAGGVTAIISEPRERDDDERLGRELRGTIEELLQARRTIELQRAEIERTSTVDRLTGVSSRGAILDRLRIEIAQARRYQHPVAVVLLDIDGFAELNHRHGVAGGDALLREVALRLRLRVREADALGRSGSDGFLAILPHTDEAGAATFAAALRHRLAQRPVPVGDELVPLTVSVGVAVMRPGDELDLDGLLARVGEALESARAAGGDRIALDRMHGLARLDERRADSGENGERAQDSGR